MAMLKHVISRLQYHVSSSKFSQLKVMCPASRRFSETCDISCHCPRHFDRSVYLTCCEVSFSCEQFCIARILTNRKQLF